MMQGMQDAFATQKAEAEKKRLALANRKQTLKRKAVVNVTAMAGVKAAVSVGLGSQDTLKRMTAKHNGGGRAYSFF